MLLEVQVSSCSDADPISHKNTVNGSVRHPTLGCRWVHQIQCELVMGIHSHPLAQLVIGSSKYYPHWYPPCLDDMQRPPQDLKDQPRAHQSETLPRILIHENLPSPVSSLPPDFAQHATLLSDVAEHLPH
ncbi:unnamed protein product [Cylindrotheca closterium]|uniref:Uncharacterized protein n=1 Tax=Cylindrotheca closterium TaxID=2856 RepID=A0AAD2CI21_9STRA|nr:unnamed protein product [Cylindrotheca closterium]